MDKLLPESWRPAAVGDAKACAARWLDQFEAGADGIIIHASTPEEFAPVRRVPRERTEMQVGPMRIEVLEPMKQARVTLDDNDSGLGCECGSRCARRRFRKGARLSGRAPAG